MYPKGLKLIIKADGRDLCYTVFEKGEVVESTGERGYVGDSIICVDKWGTENWVRIEHLTPLEKFSEEKMRELL